MAGPIGCERSRIRGSAELLWRPKLPSTGSLPTPGVFDALVVPPLCRRPRKCHGACAACPCKSIGCHGEPDTPPHGRLQRTRRPLRLGVATMSDDSVYSSGTKVVVVNDPGQKLHAFGMPGTAPGSCGVKVRGADVWVTSGPFPPAPSVSPHVLRSIGSQEGPCV